MLVTLFKNLHLLSSIDYKITLIDWVEQALKYVPTLTANEAEVYFLTYKTLLDEIENPPAGFSAKSHKGQKAHGLEEGKGEEAKGTSQKQVDVRCFALFMALQLFTQSSKFSTETRSNYASTPWPSFKENG